MYSIYLISCLIILTWGYICKYSIIYLIIICKHIWSSSSSNKMKTVKMNEEASDEKDGNGLKLLQTGLKAHYEVLFASLHCTSLSMSVLIYLPFYFNSYFTIFNLQFDHKLHWIGFWWNNLQSYLPTLTSCGLQPSKIRILLLETPCPFVGSSVRHVFYPHLTRTHTNLICERTR